MEDLVDKQLGNYRLIRLLGTGGFAQVYLGEHIHLQTMAAIKVLYARPAQGELEGFHTEARNIARLDHAHIVRVLEFDVQDNVPFLVMNYAPNGTIRQRHPRGAILLLSTIVSYVKQVADALQYAHDRKLIHRDIKPENMLVGKRNEILLSDFGIALIVQSARIQSTQDIVGTIVYMAPEQIQGKPCPASDQYALGVVVYEWLNGTPPFRGSFGEIAAQHVQTPPPPLYEKTPTIVTDVVLKALAKSPNERFATVQAFASALEEASKATQHSIPARPVSPVQQEPTLLSAKGLTLSTQIIGPNSKETLLNRRGRRISRREILIGLSGVAMGSGMTWLASALRLSYNSSTGTPTIRVVYLDSLNNQNNSNTIHANWQKDSSHCLFGSDGYHVEPDAGNPYYCTERNNIYTNFDISIDVFIKNGYSGGILFRIQENGDCYFFEVGGGFKISILTNVIDSSSQAAPLHDWDLSFSIKTPPAGPNTLRVIANGSEFAFYINNTFITQISNTSYTSGRIGFACYTDSNSSGEGIFSNLKVSLL